MNKIAIHGKTYKMNLQDDLVFNEIRQLEHRI